MNPKEKEAEKELNSQETENIAEEQLQEETTDQEAPLTKEEELEKELEKQMKQLKTRRINIFACRQNLTITGNVR